MYRLLLSIIVSSLLGAPLAFASVNLLDLDQPEFVGDELVIEANDAGERITLNEEEYAAITGQNFMNHLVSFFNFKMTFSTVASYITPTLESEFDVFIIINVDHEGRFKSSHEIPAQHMKVIQRTKAGQKLFKRNSQGFVTGIKSGVVGNNGVPAFKNGARASGKGILKKLMPISSGAGHFPNDGQSYVDTPTGIYRINHSKSDVKRYSKGMYHSLYFDLVYPGGRVSGLATHGTTRSQYKNLGGQRSHGCVRMTQAQSNVLYENLINDDFWWSNDLPDLNRRHRLKSENGKLRGGPRALIILFYGYDKALEQQDA